MSERPEGKSMTIDKDAQQINLIVNIENEFGMMFDMAEVSDLANVGEMADLIMKKAAEEE